MTDHEIATFARGLLDRIEVAGAANRLLNGVTTPAEFAVEATEELLHEIDRLDDVEAAYERAENHIADLAAERDRVSEDNDRLETEVRRLRTLVAEIDRRLAAERQQINLTLGLVAR